MIREALTFDDVLLEPKFSNIESRSNIDLSVKLSKGIETKFPIIPANMKTICGEAMSQHFASIGGLAILHRFMPETNQLDMLQLAVNNNYQNNIGFSVGVKEPDYDMVKTFVVHGAKILCIDVAHGQSKLTTDMCEFIKKTYPDIFLIAGNVATGIGANLLWRSGADAVKVGIGPGSLCTTRIETGNGVPQLTALMDAYEAKEHLQKNYKIGHDLFIIADGGIKGAGDCVKALCFADLVMAGNIFAGTSEAPGETLVLDGITYKSYDGSSTHKTNHIEGVRALVPHKGPVQNVITKLTEGIRSGLSYQGAGNLQELKEDPQFVRITNAGLKESHPHDVKVK